MGKKLKMVLLIICLWAVPMGGANAQIAVLEIIKAGVKKVIKAIDLKIQRQQNKIIWLQNAQKTLENTLSKLKLDQIGEWTEKQRKLYKEYYDELAKVKSLISYYQRIRDIAQSQIKMVEEYKRAWALIRQDKNFTSDELEYMGKVYSGILDQSIKNIDQITMVVNSFSTTMTDAKRLEIINSASDRIDKNFNDLQRFSHQNIMLSIQRSKDASDVETVKKLYGL